MSKDNFPFRLIRWKIFLIRICIMIIIWLTHIMTDVFHISIIRIVIHIHSHIYLLKIIITSNIYSPIDHHVMAWRHFVIVIVVSWDVLIVDILLHVLIHLLLDKNCVIYLWFLFLHIFYRSILLLNLLIILIELFKLFHLFSYLFLFILTYLILIITIFWFFILLSLIMSW